MKCPNCGTDVGNDFGRSCDYCGGPLRVQSSEPKARRSIARIIALTIALIGIFLLVIGLATCFMSVEVAADYYGMPIYHTTYPYREDGATLAGIGATMGIVGFVGFMVSRYRNG